MAPPSPRRSSRARATTSQSQHSSVSSVASGRADRNTRIVYKTSSGKSTPSASLSSEPPEDLDDTLLGRRRKRGQDDEDRISRPDTIELINGSEDMEEEDEAVRCICGSEEYPGCPPVDGPDADLFVSIEFTEDVTGFFVQCDICKVWQHGACVGIFSAESSPDEYFCEQCRKDLHKIHTAINGQKYSKYVPLHGPPIPSQSTSRAASVSKEGTRSPRPGSKNLRPSSSQANKRRSTMNSRDAAYDDEQLRKAIEASREETVQDTIEGSQLRRTKRGRSESDGNIPSLKRQRTDSQSESPAPELHEEAIESLTDDEAHGKSSFKKARSSRILPQRYDQDEKEKQRQEAANKRKGRAERRRADGGSSEQASSSTSLVDPPDVESDPSEEMPLATIKAQTKDSEEPVPVEEAPVPPQPTPGTPPTSHPTLSNSHKRVVRSHHKKSKGKNQYTKDRDGDREDSPARSMSRDIQKNIDEHLTSIALRATPTDSKHTTKAKTALINKMSMPDMKRRVTAIMDFISRTQVDLAAEGSLLLSSNSSSGNGSPQKTSSAQAEAAMDKLADEDFSSGIDADGQDFKDLNCMEMMDTLTRDMVKWQSHYT